MNKDPLVPIRAVRRGAIFGSRHLAVGEVAEVPESLARRLVAAGAAERAEAPPPGPADPVPASAVEIPEIRRRRRGRVGGGGEPTP